MGLTETKPVFGVSNKVRLKPVSSATENSYKIEISPVASLDMILSKTRITKVLISRGCILVCAYVVPKPPKIEFVASRPKLCL